MSVKKKTFWNSSRYVCAAVV